MERKFINYIGKNYEDIKEKLTLLSHKNGYDFDEDALQEAILRCHCAIKKKGTMTDSSPSGMEGYLFRSYVNYIREVKRSCNNSRRDKNITSDNINELYDEWYNNNNSPSIKKLEHDLYIDFLTLYIMSYVENNFDAEHFYLFRLKVFTNSTYKELAQMTGIKGVRQKVVAVKNHLKENLKEKDIKKIFIEKYGNLLYN